MPSHIRAATHPDGGDAAGQRRRPRARHLAGDLPLGAPPGTAPAQPGCHRLGSIADLSSGRGASRSGRTKDSRALGRTTGLSFPPMKFNRRMGRYLEDLRSREVEGVVPPRGPDVQIVEAGGCFLCAGLSASRT